LVTVCLLCTFANFDHPTPYGARSIL
jgi:hypothetical protein